MSIADRVGANRERNRERNSDPIGISRVDSADRGHGREGVQFYTRGKVVTARWPDPGQRGVNLGFPQVK